MRSEPAAPIRRQVVAASVWVTAGMLAGRIVGIVREFLVADTFGVTRNADVAILLITGPDVLVTIAGSGAVGLVLIPVLLEHETGTQVQLVRRLTVRLGVAATLLSAVAAGLVIVLGSTWATEGGLSSRTFTAAVLVTALAVPTSMLVVITAAFLRAQNRFAAVSLSTVTFTFPVLVAVATFRSVIGVSIGIAVGGILRYGVQAILIGRDWADVSPESVHLTLRKTDVATLFGISVMQAAQASLPLLLVAGLGDEGDVALLNYGWRILLIPIGLLASVFSVAAYPTLVRLLKESNRPRQSAVAPIIRPIILLSVAIGAWLWVNASSAIASVYGPADLDEVALAAIAGEIRAGAASIPLITIGTAATTLLFGMQRSRLGLAPYLLATASLLIAGVTWFGINGPRGLFAAITLYGAVFGVSATLLLYRSQRFALLSRADVMIAACTGAGTLAVALGSRELLPGRRFVDVVLNGLLFLACCAGGYVIAIRVRSYRRPGSTAA